MGTAESSSEVRWWSQGIQRKAEDLQWGTWEAGLEDTALLSMLWPHLGPRMDTVLVSACPALSPPTVGYTRPEATTVQKQTLEPVACVQFWLVFTYRTHDLGQVTCFL